MLNVGYLVSLAVLCILGKRGKRKSTRLSLALKGSFCLEFHFGLVTIEGSRSLLARLLDTVFQGHLEGIDV